MFSRQASRITTTSRFNMETKTELTVTQFAKAKGVTRQAILSRIPDNLPAGITCRKTGTQWVLTMSEDLAESGPLPDKQFTKNKK